MGSSDTKILGFNQNPIRGPTDNPHPTNTYIALFINQIELNYTESIKRRSCDSTGILTILFQLLHKKRSKFTFHPMNKNDE
jgi:hypothetical protein